MIQSKIKDRVRSILFQAIRYFNANYCLRMVYITYLCEIKKTIVVYMSEKKIIFGTRQFNHLIEESVKKLSNWKYKDNFNDYLIEYYDDTFEFNRFPTYMTGLPVDILLDENANYIHCKHPLWVYVPNGYINEEEQLLPVLAHRYKPCILDSNAKLNIPIKVLNRVYEFIKENYYTIVEYANARITYKDVENHLISISSLNEGILNEMPTFTSDELNLPTEVWIDGNRNVQHQPRIKFNHNGSNNTRTWATMTIDKYEPKVLNNNNETTLSNKEIEEVKDFVRTNYEVLMKIAKGEIEASKSVILKNLNIDSDPYDLLNGNSDKVNLEIAFNSNENNLYFIVQNDDEDSLNYIKYLSTVRPFTNYDKFTARLNIFDIKGDTYEKKQIIISTLKNVANKLNIKLNIININSFISIDNKFKNLQK